MTLFHAFLQYRVRQKQKENEYQTLAIGRISESHCLDSKNVYSTVIVIIIFYRLLYLRVGFSNSVIIILFLQCLILLLIYFYDNVYVYCVGYDLLTYVGFSCLLKNLFHWSYIQLQISYRYTSYMLFTVHEYILKIFSDYQAIAMLSVLIYKLN